MQEMQVQKKKKKERDAGSILGSEEAREKQMATHSSFLGWEISWTEEPGALQSMGLQRVRHDLVTKQQP